jgi:hypothetical protein
MMNPPTVQIKTQPTNFMQRFLLKTLLMAGMACLIPAAHASTFWNGQIINYTEPSVGASDVLVAGKVAFARGVNEVIYNSAQETGVGPLSPTNTAWAIASPSVISNLSPATIPSPSSFVPFTTIRLQAAGDLQTYLLNGNGSGGPITFVVYLTNADVYLTVTFTSWGRFSTGGFGYNRSTPSAVTPPTPTVSITNPSPNTVFAAPANVALSASASVSSGTVTNVSFFNGGSLLGSAQASPFNFTANGLGAGGYSLTAVATAAGVSATSAVVNMSVVTPVNTVLSARSATNSQFVFSYNVNPGLRYVVESSPDFFHWAALVTNVPASSPEFFTNPLSGSDSFFRVGRIPNP